jgi:hypothetical protein
MDDGSLEPAGPSRRSFARPILLELAPVISLVCAYVVAGILFGLFAKAGSGNEGLIGFVPPIVALVFGFSGLGWLSVGERRWGWTILGGRAVVAVAAVAMGTWWFVASLSYALCESRCERYDAPGEALVWTTATVWIIALVSPVASAVALGFWLRRHPRGLNS